MQSVFVVSRVAIYRDGIAAFLRDQTGIDVVGTAEYIDAVDGDFTLCVVDSFGHGAAEFQEFFASMRGCGIPVVVIGVLSEESEVISYLEAGASGYVTREAGLDEFLQVVLETVSNGACIQKCHASIVLRNLQKQAAATAGDPPDRPETPLTERQEQVAALLARHLSNKEIAAALGISVHTAKHHVHAAMTRLGVDRRQKVATALLDLPAPDGGVGPARDGRQTGSG